MARQKKSRIRRRLRLEFLEAREMLDCAGAELIVELPDLHVVACAGEIARAADVPISVDGSVRFTGDQIQVFFATSPGSDDKRATFVLDTNGFFRVRHPDADQPPGSEDPFGTSLVLGPTLILNDGNRGEDFHLRQAITGIEIDTSDVTGGWFRLTATGSPASDVSPLAGAQVDWAITIPLPIPFDPTVLSIDATRVQIETAVTFADQILLSQNALDNAEAFRAITFSSSNVPAENTNLGVRTHDADQLSVTDRDGLTLAELDLNTAPHNQLLFDEGINFDGTLALNQLQPAPLNWDPPNISLAIQTTDDITHQAQGFITVNESIDQDSDNLAAWISRPFASRTIAAGSQLAWRLDVLASDDVSPPRYTNLAGRLDTNGDREVSPLDVLLVINELNAGGSRQLTEFPDFPLLDTSGDGVLSPIDALLVINHLNRHADLGEGESSGSAEFAADLVFAAWAPAASQPAVPSERDPLSISSSLDSNRSSVEGSTVPSKNSAAPQRAAASGVRFGEAANMASGPFEPSYHDDFFANLAESPWSGGDILGGEWIGLPFSTES